MDAEQKKLEELFDFEPVWMRAFHSRTVPQIGDMVRFGREDHRRFVTIFGFLNPEDRATPANNGLLHVTRVYSDEGTYGLVLDHQIVLETTCWFRVLVVGSGGGIWWFRSHDVHVVTNPESDQTG